MLEHEFIEPQGILVLKPSQLTEADFAGLRKSVDDYLKSHSEIRGVMVETRSLPGWENLQAIVAHLSFVSDYHTKIRRIALVTDLNIPPGAEALVQHYVGVTAKRFQYAERDKALEWLQG